MAQPTPYTRFADYSDHQASNPLPGPALPGAGLDTEFDRIKTTLDQILNNIALIQRDDGKLRNASVSPDTITSALAIMIANWSIKGPWVTTTVYAVKDYVTESGNGYVCVVPHTAGVFAIDLAAGKWALVATAGPQGLQGIQGVQGAQGPAGKDGSAFKNLLINGCFRVDQRQAGGAYIPASTNYTLDRWRVYWGTGIAAPFAQRIVGSGGNRFAMRVRGGAGQITDVGIRQRIEANNCAHLANQNVVVSLTVSASHATTLTWFIHRANSVDNFGTTTQIATGTITINSTPTNYNFTFNAGSNAGNGLQVSFQIASLDVLQDVVFQQAQLELGTTPTAFERRTYGAELALCQRYFEKSYDDASAVAALTNVGSFGSTSVNNGTWVLSPAFKVTKRSAPTVTTYSPITGASARVRDNTGAADVASTVGASGASTVTVSAAVTANSYTFFHWTADAEL